MQSHASSHLPLDGESDVGNRCVRRADCGAGNQLRPAGSRLTVVGCGASSVHERFARQATVSAAPSLTCAPDDTQYSDTAAAVLSLRAENPAATEQTPAREQRQQPPRGPLGQSSP